jgi:hypothetical protein
MGYAGLGRLWKQRYSPVGVRIGLGCAVMAGVGLSQIGGGSTGADTAFVPGSATAGAKAISLAPTTGGLNYAITLATSLAQYENAEAQSLSQTIDLGAIGTALEAEGCDNSPPTIPKKDVPPSVQAESINGNQTLTTSITPQTTSTGIGVGNESAMVTTQPSGTATTTVQNITVPGGLVTVSGLTSSSHTSIDNGNTRVAEATSDVGAISIAKGAIVLGGLHWAATQESGAKTLSTATFSLGSLKVSGVAVPLPATTSPQVLLNIINTVGAPLGFNIQWPASSTLPDGTVVISPLTIGIDNNTLGQEIVGSNLVTVQPVRAALVNAILAADCNLASEVTVGDIGIGVLAGGGNLNLNLGGANAVTSSAAAVNPFGSAGGGGAISLPTDTTPVISSLPSTSTFTPPSLGTTGTVAPVTPTTTGGGTSRQSIGPIQRTTDCVSLSPAGGGCNTSNVAVPIGLIGLGLVLLLAAWDYMRQRRRAQMQGQEALA